MSESVELTESEREELFRAGNHRPDQCDCMASGYEPHTQICDALADTYDVVARIKAAARREALLEAKTLAAGRYSAWLPSPGLSSDWVAGWHAANNDITTTLQVATERDEEGR